MGRSRLAAPLCAILAAAFAMQAQAAPQPDYKTSEEHYAALKAKAKGGTVTTAATLPDWEGLWTHVRSTEAMRASAPLRPEFAAQYAKVKADAARGIDWDHLSYCLPAAYPRSIQEPFLREFVLKPKALWFINEMVSEVRRIYMDGRGHPPADEAFPLWEGHSIGFWDGDGLVVHTTNVKAFPSGYNRNGPPHSDQLTSIEVWRKVDPGRLHVDVTYYDPVTLARPWHVFHDFEKVDTPGLRIDQWVCEENNNVVKTAQGSTDFVLPGEPGYKDPNVLAPPHPAQ